MASANSGSPDAGGLSLAHVDVQVFDLAFRLTTLKDRQQFADPGGYFESLGISPATWPLFGVTWSSGITLAELMTTEPIEGLRILEVGCGLGLASLVLKRRGADITASDIHPMAGEFLSRNARDNNIEPVRFLRLDWQRPPDDLPQYDLIIGSDLLYEREQPAMLAGFVPNHTNRMILTDPGRGQAARFSRAMEAAGFRAESIQRGKERIVRYERSIRSHTGASDTT
ncbi:MAG: methyltransferase domain-containing protein [Pseudomonadales bacterium]|nr:methyltransferase domain-containing protein [Pseudomonadales bacterium]